MTAILLPSGRLRYHAYVSGVYGPAVGYKLYTYEAGTTTPKATYADSDAATPLANPIVLDANGECAPYGVGTYKLLLADPSGATVPGWPQDNVSLSNSFADEEWCGTATGTANALTLSPTIGISAYLSGQRFAFVAASANLGAVTVNVSGVGTVALTKNGNTALAADDLQTGRLYQIQYDGVRFQLASDPRATLTVTAPATSDNSDRVITSAWFRGQAASDTTPGIQENATEAEYQTGTATDRTVTVAVARAQNLVLTTAQATTSGTAIDFTGIPSWVKRITVMFSGISTTAGNLTHLQIGDSGGIETTGYECATTSGTSTNSATTAFLLIANTTTAAAVSGHAFLTKIDGNEWIFSGISNGYSGVAGSIASGKKTLSSTLDRIRLTNAAADTFDAGKVNIIYE